MTDKNTATEIVRQFIESEPIIVDVMVSRWLDEIPMDLIAKELEGKILRESMPLKEDTVYYRLLDWAISHADYLELVEEFLDCELDIAR